MALSEHEIEVAAGRRATDGRVHVSIFAGHLLALTVEGHGERAPTLLLTPEQARKLQAALSELIPLAEESEQEKGTGGPQAWAGSPERRMRGGSK
jgi:hypothetical protein